MGRPRQSEKVYEQLRKVIESREFPAGSLLPREVELAPRFGVSRGTVRLALDRLAEEKLIERTKRRGTVVTFRSEELPTVLFSGLSSFSFSDYTHLIAEGVRLRAGELGMACEQINIFFLASGVGRMPERPNIKGMVFASTNVHGDEPEIQLLRDLKLPVVLAHCYREDPERSGFGRGNFTDFCEAARMAFRYFAELGHRRCGYFGFVRPPWTAEPDQLLRAMAEAGCEAEMSRLCVFNRHRRSRLDPDGAVGEEVLVSSFDRLLAAKTTAVVAASDALAVELYKICYERRMRIPEDLSILSLGGNLGAELLYPALTVVDFGYAHSGALAVDQLLGRAPGKICTPCHIVERKSCQPYQKGNQ